MSPTRELPMPTSPLGVKGRRSLASFLRRARPRYDERRTMAEPTVREPEDIRRDCARKLGAVQVSDHFRAILGCLLGEDWTTPRLVEMVITPDGHLLGRCEGEASFRAFLGASAELLKNVHGVAEVAELDGDEIGYLVGKVAEIKRQR
jgi:hypothetical protein